MMKPTASTDRGETARARRVGDLQFGGVLSPSVLLRLEGAMLLIAALMLYREHGASWLLFALLVFAPDLSMVGFMAGPRWGTAIYNLAHTTTVPLALALVGLVAERDLALAVGLIWLAHIGLDRLVGYGFKYPQGFRETHLARV